MLREESIWIRDVLSKIELSNVRTVLDVGSSTEVFRTRMQPYIDENVFKPLRERSIAIYHMDKKNGKGVDLVYDIENTSSDIIRNAFDIVLCCNLMEHVNNPDKLASRLIHLVNPGGFLMVTVPRSYRYHEDPIDTMFRPSMDQLVSLFAGLRPLNKATLRIKDRDKYRSSELIRYLVPFLNWKVNCLLLRKRRS